MSPWSSVPARLLNVVTGFGTRRFWQPLLATQCAHSAGDALVTVALADTLFFDVPLDGARWKVGLYLIATLSPLLLVWLVIGPWVDARGGGERLTIAIAGFGRAAFAVALAVFVDTPLLYALAFGLLVLSRAYGVARRAIVPSAAGADHVLQANGTLSAAGSVIGLVAGGIGLAVATVAESSILLVAAAASFAAVGWLTPRLPRPLAKSRRRPRAQWTPYLGAARNAVIAARCVVGFVTFLIAFLLRGEGSQLTRYAVVAAVAGVGVFLGNVAAPLLRRANPRALIGTLVALAAQAAWIALGFSLGVACAVAFATGVASSVSRITFDSIIQNDAPVASRGRLLARAETVFQLGWALGAGVAALVALDFDEGMVIVAFLAMAGIVTSVDLLRPGALGSRQTRVRTGR